MLLGADSERILASRCWARAPAKWSRLADCVSGNCLHGLLYAIFTTPQWPRGSMFAHECPPD